MVRRLANCEDSLVHNLFTIDSNIDQVIKKLGIELPQQNWSNFLEELRTLPHCQKLGQFDEAVAEQAQIIRSEFDDVVLLGTGGSSLGGQAIAALQTTCAPRLHFMDNVDPLSFNRLFNQLDIDRTAVVVTSKSGNTMETMAQLLWCLKQFSGREVSKHFTIITEHKNNLLRELAEHYNIICLGHPDDIGGRFAALTVVGELPARIAGLDITALHQGAKQVYDDTMQEKADAAPLRLAIATAALREHGVSQSVLMPYIDRLELLGEWYCQLWAESLGKQKMGTTPIRALGTVDQHSQLQLYLDGPRDKLFSLILLEHFEKDSVLLAPDIKNSLLSLLRDRTMGDLLLAEQAATFTTLKNNGLPVRAFILQHLDEQVLGGLMAHFVIETLATAHLWQVNPFDQPAVEEGKQLTRKYLERVT